MAKLYQYTRLNQDGTKEVLAPCKKKEFGGEDGLYKLLDCQTIELIPKDYYADNMNKRATIFGDEEGRFSSLNVRNPHMKVLKDALYGDEWDTVGNLIMEEVYKGDK